MNVNETIEDLIAEQKSLDNVVAGPHILGDIDSGFGSIDVIVVGGTGVYTYSWSSTLADVECLPKLQFGKHMQ